MLFKKIISNIENVFGNTKNGNFVNLHFRKYVTNGLSTGYRMRN